MLDGSPNSILEISSETKDAEIPLTRTNPIRRKHIKETKKTNMIIYTYVFNFALFCTLNLIKITYHLNETYFLICMPKFTFKYLGPNHKKMSSKIIKSCFSTSGK